MLVKQLSVFIENKTGGLAPIIDALGKNDVDISALSLADTSEYGILRIIAGKSRKIYCVIKQFVV